MDERWEGNGTSDARATAEADADRPHPMQEAVDGGSPVEQIPTAGMTLPATTIARPAGAEATDSMATGGAASCSMPVGNMTLSTRLNQSLAAAFHASGFATKEAVASISKEELRRVIAHGLSTLSMEKLDYHASMVLDNARAGAKVTAAHCTAPIPSRLAAHPIPSQVNRDQLSLSQPSSLSTSRGATA